MDESIGFASIKVKVEDWLPIETPTILHKLPTSVSEELIDIAAIERDLKEGLFNIIVKKELQEGKLGLFIEYTVDKYLLVK